MTIHATDWLPQPDKKIGFGGSISMCGKRTTLGDAIAIVPQIATIPMFMLPADPHGNM